MDLGDIVDWYHQGQLYRDLVEWRDLDPNAKPNQYGAHWMVPKTFENVLKAVNTEYTGPHTRYKFGDAVFTMRTFIDDCVSEHSNRWRYDPSTDLVGRKSEKGVYVALPQEAFEYAVSVLPIEYYKKTTYQRVKEGHILDSTSDIFKFRTKKELLEDGITFTTNVMHTKNTPFINEDYEDARIFTREIWGQLNQGCLAEETFVDPDSGEQFIIFNFDLDRGEEYLAIPVRYLRWKSNVPGSAITHRVNQTGIRFLPEISLNKDDQETKATETPTESIKIKKETKVMMTPNFNAKELLDQNKDALLLAAKIEVGEAAVKQVSKIVKKQLPMMMRGYADLPVFDIVVANLVVMALKQFAPDNQKAQVIADAMLLAAMHKQMREFDLAGMVDEFVSGIDVSKITNLDNKGE